MSTQPLERAFASTRKVLANLKPEHLEAGTPCRSWDVKALLKHLVGGSHWFADAMAAGEAKGNPEENVTDFTPEGLLAAYDEGIKKALDAFSAEDAMTKTVQLPFGPFPGQAFMGLAMMDTFQHGWDLARATGQDSNLDPELAEQLLEQAQIPDAFRGLEGKAPFAAKVDVPDDAPPADRLAAYLGRQV